MPLKTCSSAGSTIAFFLNFSVKICVLWRNAAFRKVDWSSVSDLMFSYIDWWPVLPVDWDRPTFLKCSLIETGKWADGIQTKDLAVFQGQIHGKTHSQFQEKGLKWRKKCETFGQRGVGSWGESSLSQWSFSPPSCPAPFGVCLKAVASVCWIVSAQKGCSRWPD